MPYFIYLPSGQRVPFEDDVPEEEARLSLIDRYPEEFPDYEESRGPIAAGMSMFERMKGAVTAAPDIITGALTGDQEAIDVGQQKYREADAAARGYLPDPSTTEDVAEAWREGGLFPAGKEAGIYAGQRLAESSLYMVPAYGAAKVGASTPVAGSRLGKGIGSLIAKAIPAAGRAAAAAPHPAVKMALGAVAGVGTLTLQFFADNLQRQHEAGATTPEEYDIFSAAMAAPLQGGLDYVFIALTGGIGRASQVAAAQSIGAAMGSAGRETARKAMGPWTRTAVQSLTEFPTELGQTVLERAQAGESISPRDAEFVREMWETAWGTLPVAGGFGALGGYRASRAHKKAEKSHEEKMEREKVLRDKTPEQIRDRLAREEQESTRIQDENQARYQAALDEARARGDWVNVQALEAASLDDVPVDDIIEAAESRNLKWDNDDGFHALSRRVTGQSRLSDLEGEENLPLRRRLYSIITGFKKQDTATSIPFYTEDMLQDVLKGLKSSQEVTPDRIRRVLRLTAENALGTRLNNKIASEIMAEMKHRRVVRRNKGGKLVLRNTGYNEDQYSEMLSEAQNRGLFTRDIVERVTDNYDHDFYKRVREDMVKRGDLEGRPNNRWIPKEGIALITEGNLKVVPDKGFYIRESGNIVGGASTRSAAERQKKIIQNNDRVYALLKNGVEVDVFNSPSKAQREKRNGEGVDPTAEWTTKSRVPELDIDRVKSEGFRVTETVTSEGRPRGVSELGFFFTEDEATQARDSRASEYSGARPWELRRAERVDEERRKHQEVLARFPTPYEDPALRLDPDVTPEERVPREQFFPQEFTAEEQERVDYFVAELEKRLNKLGLPEVSLRIKDALSNPSAEGVESLHRITLAFSRIDRKLSKKQQLQELAGILDHETLHAMKELDLVNENEWRAMVLSSARVKMPDAVARKRGLEEGSTFADYGDAFYGNETPARREEEAVAEMWRTFRDDPSILVGRPRTLLGKIQQDIERLYNAATGVGYGDAGTVFNAILSGDITARERGVLRRPVRQEDAAVAIAPTIVPRVAGEGPRPEEDTGRPADFPEPAPARESREVAPGPRYSISGAPAMSGDENIRAVQLAAWPEPAEGARFAAPDVIRWNDKDWDRVSGALGSNVGGMYESEGQRIYAKFPNHPSQSLVEVVGETIARAMGLPAKDSRIIRVEDGRVGVLSPVLDIQDLGSGRNISDLAESDPSFRSDLISHYVHAVLTRNWDVVGLTADNLVRLPDGRPIVVDYGGSLHWRAQGAPKPGGLPPADPTEIEHLRRPPPGSEESERSIALSGITDEEIANEINRVAGPELDSAIDMAVRDSGFAALPSSVSPNAEEISTGLKIRAAGMRDWASARVAAPEVSRDDIGKFSIARLPEKGTPGSSSAVDLLGAVQVIEGTGKNGKILIKDVVSFLEDRYPRRDPNDPAVFNDVVDQMVAEVGHQLSSPESGKLWYDEAIDVPIDITSKLIPELETNEDYRVLQVALASIMSNQSQPKNAWFGGASAMYGFIKDGVIPERNPLNGKGWFGQHNDIVRKIRLINGMIDRMTLPTTNEWLLTKHKIGEIRSMKREIVRSTGDTGVSGKADDTKLGAHLFGPKLGPFFLDLNGYDELVMDSWWTRAYNRHFGMISGPGKVGNEGYVAAPRSDTERDLMRKLARAVSERTGLSVKEVQAVEWFFEKNLYEHLGVPSVAGMEFEDGARRLIEEFGSTSPVWGSNEAKAAFEQRVEGEERAAPEGTRVPGAEEARPIVPGPNTSERGAIGNIVDDSEIAEKFSLASLPKPRLPSLNLSGVSEDFVAVGLTWQDRNIPPGLLKIYSAIDEVSSALLRVVSESVDPSGEIVLTPKESEALDFLLSDELGEALVRSGGSDPSSADRTDVISNFDTSIEYIKGQIESGIVGELNEPAFRARIELLQDRKEDYLKTNKLVQDSLLEGVEQIDVDFLEDILTVPGVQSFETATGGVNEEFNLLAIGAAFGHPKAIEKMEIWEREMYGLPDEVSTSDSAQFPRTASAINNSLTYHFSEMMKHLSENAHDAMLRLFSEIQRDTGTTTGTAGSREAGSKKRNLQNFMEELAAYAYLVNSISSTKLADYHLYRGGSLDTVAGKNVGDTVSVSGIAEFTAKPGIANTFSEGVFYKINPNKANVLPLVTSENHMSEVGIVTSGKFRIVDISWASAADIHRGDPRENFSWREMSQDQQHAALTEWVTKVFGTTEVEQFHRYVRSILKDILPMEGVHGDSRKFRVTEEELDRAIKSIGPRNPEDIVRRFGARRTRSSSFGEAERENDLAVALGSMDSPYADFRERQRILRHLRGHAISFADDHQQWLNPNTSIYTLEQVDTSVNVTSEVLSKWAERGQRSGRFSLSEGDPTWIDQGPQGEWAMDLMDKTPGFIPRVNPRPPINEPQRPVLADYPDIRDRAFAIARGEIDPEPISDSIRERYSIDATRLRGLLPEEDRVVAMLSPQPINRSFGAIIIDSLKTRDLGVLRGQARDAIEWLRQKTVHGYTGFEKMERKMREVGVDERVLMADTRAMAAAHFADRAPGVAQQSITDGVVVYRNGMAQTEEFMVKLSDGTEISGGLLQILAPLFREGDGKNLIREWHAYMIAKRERRFDSEGKMVQTTERERRVAEALAVKHPEIAIAAENYGRWNSKIVEFMRDTGVINAELAEVWKRYGDYIPFYRQLDGEASERFNGQISQLMDKEIAELRKEGILPPEERGAYGQVAPRSMFGSLTGVRPPRKAKGGEQMVVEPIEGVTRNLVAAITAGMKNVAGGRAMRDATLPGVDMAEQVETAAESTHQIRINGEDAYFVVHDSLLFDSLSGMMEGKMPFLDFIAAPSTLLRETVTRSPDFILANLLRDTLSTYVVSGADTIGPNSPFVGTMKNFFSGGIRGKGKNLPDSFKALKGSGIVGGFDNSRDPKDMRKSFMKELRKRGLSTDKSRSPWSMMKTTWDWAGDVTTKSDAATRMAVYDDVFQRVMAKGKYSPETAQTEAIYQALEIINFSRRGNSLLARVVTAAIPFLNARVQGIDKLWQGARGRADVDVSAHYKKRAMMKFIARGMSLAALSALYSLMIIDDESWKNERPEVQDDNWFLPGFGIFDRVLIPIPFEVGIIFKVIPERLMRYFWHKDQDTRQTMASMRRAVVSTLEFNPFGAQITKPIIENMTNYSFFSGRKVVPSYLSDNLDPSEQYTATTNQFSVMLGKAFNVSPMKVHNFLAGYTGTIGSYVLTAADYVMRDWAGLGPTRPELRVDQYIIARRFLPTPGEFGAGPATDFYDFRQGVEQVVGTFNRLKTTGRISEAREYAKENRDILALQSQKNYLDRAVTKLREAELRILLSDMPPEEKARRAEQISKRRNRLLASRMPQLRRRADLPVKLPFPFSVLNR